MKRFVVVLVVLLTGCVSRYEERALLNRHTYKPANNQYYVTYPATSSYRIIDPNKPMQEDIKKPKPRYNELNNGYIKVNGENRKAPYEENGEMVYIDIDTGKPMSTSHRLQIK